MRLKFMNPDELGTALGTALGQLVASALNVRFNTIIALLCSHYELNASEVQEYLSAILAEAEIKQD